MPRRWVRVFLLGTTVVIVLAAGLPGANAIHFYRSTDGGCSAADGALTDDPPETLPIGNTNVVVGHNTFSEGVLGTGIGVRDFLVPVETRIRAGESITWTWNSAHCHSVTSVDPGFDSGFIYPVTPPESPRVLPGIFEYPILDDTPTLSYTHTFTTPGTYEYFCVHHEAIGMRGVVVVQP